jgi:hypothetical protein
LGGGELIAFERVAPGAGERALYAIRPEGGEPRLLRSPGDYPHWSPDGSKLACLNPPDCTTSVALLERSTGDVHGFSMPDPDLFTACAVWAPSGRELACEGVSEGDPTRNGVYTVRASDSGALTRITTNPGGGTFLWRTLRTESPTARPHVPRRSDGPRLVRHADQRWPAPPDHPVGIHRRLRELVP